MKVTVVGTGHVGLITCVAMASMGHDVIGNDVDDGKMTLLEQAKTPFYEPGLDMALNEELRSGRLRFVRDPQEAHRDADVVFLCVGTPARANGEANLVALEQSATQVARYGKDGVVIVEKSTVPAGTAERLQLSVLRERPEMVFDVASNPEFLREGTAMQDALQPDRIVVGAESERAFQRMRELYAPLTRQGYRLLETDICTAELAKHASNAFLAMKISYANGLARICEHAGADVEAVAEVMGTDPRIGRAFLNAGLGWGGYCFPKDVAALSRLSARLGYDFTLLTEVARLNDQAVEAAAHRVQEALWNLEDKRIAVLGLAFKGGTDDVRFSPAIELARRLAEGGAHVVAYDPVAGPNALREMADLELATSPYEAVAGAHCLVVATDWAEFRDLSLERVRRTMAYPVIVDGRNMLDPGLVAAHGFTYYAMGRPTVLPTTQNLLPAPRESVEAAEPADEPAEAS